jgi:hypothetical protein
MSDLTLTKSKIIQELMYIPDERLKEVELFIKSILNQSDMKSIQKEPRSLAGIWKDKGFEQLIDIDKEIDIIRLELDKPISEKIQ